MARSIWKGKPVCLYFLRLIYRKILSLIIEYRLQKRNIFLFKHFLGKTFYLYNGYKVKLLRVTKSFLGFYASAFILSRYFGVEHVLKKTKKQKEAELRTKNAKKTKLGKSKTKQTKNSKLKNSKRKK